MFVKKFEAESLEQALQLVKSELGPNALILSTSKKKNNWFKKESIEVTAALDKRDGGKRGEAAELAAASKLDEIFPHRKTQKRDEAPGLIPKTKTPQKYVDIGGGSDPARNGKPNWVKFEEGFLKLGLSPESSREISQRLVYDYPKSDLQVVTFLEKAKTRVLAAGVKTVTLQEFASRGSWVALGTAGSGKTSLLVKLGLHLKNQKIPVVLVSCDERKIIGKSEMLAYARLIKVPFYETPAPTQDKGKLQLIDSPALCLKDSEDDRALGSILENQTRTSFLVLDATARLSELRRVVDYSLRYNPRAIAFTRLDIAAQRGVIYDLLKLTKLPLLGVSESHSFKLPFRFFTPTELASYLLSRRGNA